MDKYEDSLNGYEEAERIVLENQNAIKDAALEEIEFNVTFNTELFNEQSDYIESRLKKLRRDAHTQIE